MPLSAGTRLGVYDITALIGVGGMGEVYRAHDTTLNRDVAIKVLPADFADDAERRSRFEREAQVVASLNHPNIAGIYGLAEGNGIRGLALELVDGPTLAEMLAHGSGTKRDEGHEPSALSPEPFRALPLDEALSIANQIANALAAAHEKGIIHRDLKPANVKVRPDGSVKVLDFGLAKAFDPRGQDGAIEPLNSPTLSLAATRVGVILGTAAYMSPEQARGKPVDKRTDIWAFGCVLYEMLAGRRPFDAEDVSMTLASVMMKEPEWTALPDDIPAHIRTVVKRCLEKDRKLRLADIAVAQFLINEPLPAPIVIAAPSPVVAASEPKRTPLARVVAAATAFVLALAAAVGTTLWILRPVAPQPVRFAIVPPTAQPLTIQGFQRDIAITPDGTRVALDIRDQENDVWIWDLKRDTLTRLTFDPGADQFPVWTPDSRRIVFSSARGGAQNLYWQAADNTGAIERLTTSPNMQLSTSMSPDGIRVLFYEVAPKTNLDIGMLTLTGPSTGPSPALRASLPTATTTTPGLRPFGELRVAPSQVEGRQAQAVPSPSRDATGSSIVPRPTGPPLPQASASLDVARKSDVGPLIQTAFNEQNAEISPDGRWVAYQSNESSSIQVYVRPFPKVDTGHWQVSTNGGTKPVWARSGRELFYAATPGLMVVPVQTAGPLFSPGSPTKLFDVARYYFGNNGRTYDVSADGQRFLMIKLDASNEQTSTTTPASLIVVEHWTEELKARAGTK